MKEKGVSPVVGTILLIAITVALAAVVATLVSGLGGRGTPPSAMLTVTAENTGSTTTLSITHEGGDDLALADLKVKAIDSTEVENTKIGTGTFSVGDDKNVIMGLDTKDGDVITVYIIHEPSKQKIFSSSSVVVRD